MKSLFLTIALVLSSVCFSQTKVRITSVEIGNITSDTTVEWVSRDSINKIIIINEGVSVEMDSAVYRFTEQVESNPGVYRFTSINEKTKQMCLVTYFKTCVVMGEVNEVVVVDVGNKTYYYVGKLD